MQDTMPRELTAKCLELIYSQSANANLASLAGGTLLGVLFWDVADRAVILAWGAAYLLMILYRYRLGQRFGSDPGAEASERWASGFRLAVGVSGVLWGAFAVYLASLGTPIQVAVVALTVGALLSGAAIAYSVLITAFLAFALPAVLPLGLYLLVRGRGDEFFLGVLMLIWTFFMYRSARRFREFAIRSLGYQFENASLVLRLQELSHTDSLTGLSNRRRFDEALAQAWHQASGAGGTLSVALCDVDHFKAYNDAYGHPAGDACLQRVAGVLAEVAEAAGGMTARVGGEEFAFLLPATDADGMQALAERARGAMEAAALPHRDADPRGTVSLSFGVGTLPASASFTPSQLLALADRALYEAKHQGRNRVVSLTGPD